MEKLTKNQKIVLNVIQNYFLQKGYPPLLKELQILLKERGIRVASLNSVTQYLKALENKGYIERHHRKKRSIYLASKQLEDIVKIPLVGMADCGEPLIFADEAVEDFIDISKKFIRGDANKYFIIQAVGDSMNKIGINDGDFILVRNDQTSINGDIVVAVIDECATIKKYKEDGNSIILFPCSTNPKHKPIFLHPEDKYIISGKVAKVFKGKN